MVTHIIRRDRGIRDSAIMHPLREWLFGVGASAAFILVGVSGTVLLYQSYNQSSEAHIPLIETVAPYKAAEVHQALTIYNAKKAAYNDMLGDDSAEAEEVPTVPPNSLPPEEESVAASTTNATSTVEEVEEGAPAMSEEPEAVEVPTLAP